MAYIDRENFIAFIDKKIDKSGLGCVIGNQLKDYINKQPTADVVEVVRCKDCIFYESNCCFNRQWDLESSTEVPLVRETDFCSYGERRDT